LVPTFGKFAGEKLHWQAAKTKKPEKIALRKSRAVARVAPPPGNPAAGDEGTPAPAFP